MGKKIAWTDPAKADLRAIDQPTALRILHIYGSLSRHRRRGCQAPPDSLAQKSKTGRLYAGKEWLLR